MNITCPLSAYTHQQAHPSVVYTNLRLPIPPVVSPIPAISSRSHMAQASPAAPPLPALLILQDLSMYHFACAAEQHYKEHYGKRIADAPLLLALRNRVAERPNIKA